MGENSKAPVSTPDLLAFAEQVAGRIEAISQHDSDANRQEAVDLVLETELWESVVIPWLLVKAR